MEIIKLSEVCLPDWHLLRDGEFASLGLCSAKSGIPLLTFCGNRKFLRMALKNPDVSCVLVPEELGVEALEADNSRGICAVPDLRKNFFELHNRLCSEKWRERYVGTDSPIEIDASASVAPEAVIASENIKIGANTVIEPGVIIYGNVVIGSDCIIRSGSVLGGTGLEFIRIGADRIIGVEHRGSLVIGNRVEIQYNCNVSRSLFPWHETRIGDDSKIESLVHIAHGAHIGKRCLIAASACVCGSAEIGDDVWIGPNATVSSEVKVGNGARITIGAVAAADVAPGKAVSGNFAVDHDLFMMDLLRKLRE